MATFDDCSLKLPLAFAVSLALVACGGASKGGAAPEEDAGPAQGMPDTGAPPPASDAGGGESDAAPPPVDAGAPDVSIPNDPVDGTPTRQACTGSFGSALTMDHGRLDGTLVSIVQPGTHGCNADSSHLHLQLLVNGSVYDVAANLDTYAYEQDMAIPGGAWSEGWHPNESLDYPTIGVHKAAFTLPASQQALAQQVTTELENANHLAVFATGYGATGVHDVHRRGTGGEDGAIIIDPLAATSHVLFFCFDTDSF